MMIEFLERYLALGLHIPDGFLSLPVSAAFWLITIAGIGIAVRRTNRSLDERQAPLMGVMAACIFAAQMLNFPVAGGTSGHLLGGALAAIVLGPSAAVLIMTCVIALQALLFQDGGIVAMGANIFDMGILTTLIGGPLCYALVSLFGRRPWAIMVSGFVAAWLSVVAAALLAAVQLVISGTAQATVVIAAMGGVHMLIGIGEGLITAFALSFLLATRPDVLPSYLISRPGGASLSVSARALLGTGLALAALLALLSPLASSAPDGLERVAADLGFLDGGFGPGASSPVGVLPDYTVPGLEGGGSTILAGLVGVLIVVALGYTLALSLLRRRRNSAATPERSGLS